MEIEAEDYNQKSDSMELVISLLLQYPQVNKVNVNLNSQEVIFTFLIQRELSISGLKEFKSKLNQSLRLYGSLSQIDVAQIKIDYKCCGDLTELEITSGLCNLTEEVISFIIRFIYNEFGTELLSEDIVKDNSTVENEIINELLENLKVNNLNQRLVGFREKNKVLVFNKANN
ncbi:hypothetical protein [Sporohalobacter salinus]|uniref:hypothetical protein n=1 Tax=Sporohalobacter salinus TaxID=1494606 RepID=UPI00196095E5|nr:hypothetical protein [Sporohalobacter salinus]MBM7623272.1 hypothetical protein [Sporohalobacter salinus]